MKSSNNKKSNEDMEMTQISIDRLIKTKNTQTHNEKNSFFVF